MLAVPAVDPASAPMPTNSLALAAAPNVTLSPRALPAVSLVPSWLNPTAAISPIPVPRVAFAPAPPKGDIIVVTVAIGDNAKLGVVLDDIAARAALDGEPGIGDCNVGV